MISTINGDANVPFYKELGNQGVKATDIPVIGLSVGEEELAGIAPLLVSPRQRIGTELKFQYLAGLPLAAFDVIGRAT